MLLKGGEHGVELGLEVGEVGLELRGGLLAPRLRVSIHLFLFYKMRALIPVDVCMPGDGRGRRASKGVWVYFVISRYACVLY